MQQRVKNNVPESIVDLDEKKIIESACHTLDISVNVLLSTTRKRAITEARHMICRILYVSQGSLSLKKIGKLLNRDHSSIIYAIKTCNDMLDTCPDFESRYNLIMKNLS